MAASDINIILPTGKQLPALSEHRFLRYFAFAALYIAQGIPEGLTYFALPAWMAMQGKTPAEIGGILAIYTLPWSLKILVAPLMDRFTLLSMGRRRPWVMFGQIGLIISMINLAFVHDPLHNYPALIFALFFVGFFGAFQDVATDGMAIDIIPVQQQARANGIMWGSKTVGIAASTAIASWLINAYSFSVAILCLASVVVLIFFIPLFLRERPGEKLLPFTAGKANIHSIKVQAGSFISIFKNLLRVLFLPASLFMIFSFMVMTFGFNLMNAILPVFTVQELDWKDTEFSKISSLGSLIGGLTGMVAGGFLYDHFGKKRMLRIYLFLLILFVSILAFSPSYWTDRSFVISFIICFNVLYPLITIGIFSVCMQLTWKPVSITQFTTYMTLSNIAYALGAASLGFLKSKLEWNFVLFIVALLAMGMMGLLRFVNLPKHANQLEALDASKMQLTN